MLRVYFGLIAHLLGIQVVCQAEHPMLCAWDKSKGKELGLQAIWRDDKFTYLRGQFQETPALYEVKDKKPSLINFDFSNGLYTVPKELDNGYLAIGKQKVEFHRTEEAR